VVDQIKDHVQNIKQQRGEDQQELSKKEKEEIASYGQGSE
jgi:hypothetical protein